MSGTKMEEIDCCNFFEQIDDLLECPNDDVEKGLVNNGIDVEYNDFPPVYWSESSPVFSAATSKSASDLSTELFVPVSFYTFKALPRVVNFVIFENY